MVPNVHRTLHVKGKVSSLVASTLRNFRVHQKRYLRGQLVDWLRLPGLAIQGDNGCHLRHDFINSLLLLGLQRLTLIDDDLFIDITTCDNGPLLWQLAGRILFRIIGLCFGSKVQGRHLCHYLINTLLLLLR